MSEYRYGFAKYSPSQPRDAAGRWTSGGGGTWAMGDELNGLIGSTEGQDDAAIAERIPRTPEVIEGARHMLDELTYNNLDTISEDELMATAVRAVRSEWNTSSSSDLAASVQDAAYESGLTTNQRYNGAYDYLIDSESPTWGFLNAYVHAQYDHTQSVLREKGIAGVVAYRGIGLEREGYSTPTSVHDVEPGALNSFSANQRVAEDFAKNVPDNYWDGEGTPYVGHVLRARIPAKDIWSIGGHGVGTIPERELVVLGWNADGAMLGNHETGEVLTKALRRPQRDEFGIWMATRGRLQKYSPSQPRDDAGRWTSGGGGGAIGQLMSQMAADPAAYAAHGAAVMDAAPLEGESADVALFGHSSQSDYYRRNGHEAAQDHLVADALIADRMTRGEHGELVARVAPRIDIMNNFSTPTTAVNSVSMAWNASSNNHYGLDLQDAALRNFGTTEGSADMLAGIKRRREGLLGRQPLTGDRAQFMDEYVKATYAHTQARLAPIAGKTVRLYRGLNLGSDGVQSHTPRPLSSWTTTRAKAEIFAQGTFGGHILSAEIPVEDIFSVGGNGPGSTEMHEVIVLGRESQIVTAEIAKHALSQHEYRTGFKKYSPSQPRDDAGRWTSGGGGGGVVKVTPSGGKPSDFVDDRMAHQAPTNDGYNPPITRADDIYPADVYGPKGHVYYGSGTGDAEDLASVNTLRRVRGNPDAPVTVYRTINALDNGTLPEPSLRPGDWVTPSLSYAQGHARSDRPFVIIEAEVPAGHLYTDANSLMEWGFDPSTEVAKYSPSQPRDRNGRWSGGVSVDDVRHTITADFPGIDFSFYGKGKDGWNTLSKIEVPKEQRGQGIGRKAMESLIAAADSEGWKIDLTPTDDFGMSKTRLQKWYKSFGFVDNKGRNKDFTTRESMIRLPATDVAKYSASQARDERGRWTSGGGGVPQGTVSVKIAHYGATSAMEDAELKDNLSHAFNAIEATHGLSRDYDLTVNTMDGLDMAEVAGDERAVGFYDWSTYGELTVRRDVRRSIVMQSTIVHEYGHLLDAEFLHASQTPNWADDKKAALFETMRATDYKFDLDNTKKVPAAHRKQYEAYLDAAPELFARGYAQWVATRSGDPRLLKVAELEAGAGHWRAEDFGPIADAFDDYFASKGLGKSG